MTSSGQGMISTWRGFTVFFFDGVVRGGVRRGALRVTDSVILLVAILEKN